MSRPAVSDYEPGQEPWPAKTDHYLNEMEMAQLRKIRAAKLEAEQAEEMLLLESWFRKLPPPGRN